MRARPLIAVLAVTALAAAVHAAGKGGRQAASAAGKSSPQKAVFEDHLRRRIKKIADVHTARLRFVGREGEAWKEFWDKVKADRELFEKRMAEQGLALFNSLASISPKDHATHISNYERLQGDVIKSFEAQQKERLAAFFAERQSRLQKAAAEAERERADFAAEAAVAWDEHKAKLRAGRDPAAQAAERAEPVVDAPPAPEPPRPVLEPARSPLKTRPSRKRIDDKWH